MTIARDIAAWISASETAKGPVELATQAEVDAGTDDTRVVTPDTLEAADIPATDGGLLEIEVFKSDGTWTKPAGCKLVEVICLGDGGGGAGVSVGSDPQFKVGGAGGGGGGAYALFDADDLSATEPVTVGQGGAAGAAGDNAGSTGDSTTFNGFTGTYFCAATAGGGGGVASANNIGAPGAGGNGSVGSGSLINNIYTTFRGSPGGGGYVASGQLRGSDGGGTPFGGMNAAHGAPAILDHGGWVGGDGRDYGVGGGGAVVKDPTSPPQTKVGVSGHRGYCIVKSYG
jgi:hypothetical protein